MIIRYAFKLCFNLRFIRLCYQFPHPPSFYPPSSPPPFPFPLSYSSSFPLPPHPSTTCIYACTDVWYCKSSIKKCGSRRGSILRIQLQVSLLSAGNHDTFHSFITALNDFYLVVSIISLNSFICCILNFYRLTTWRPIYSPRVDANLSSSDSALSASGVFCFL